MQEHDLTFVRAEMVLAQKPPRSASGFVHWAQTNLFATIPDTILTVFGLLLTAVIVVPLVRWGFVNAVWTGTDRSFCATVAQGGIQPDGWSGACWAFVSAKFQQFMVGSYPFDGTLARRPDGRPVRGPAGAADDPEGAVQVAQRHRVLRRLSDRRLHAADRRSAAVRPGRLDRTDRQFRDLAGRRDRRVDHRHSRLRSQRHWRDRARNGLAGRVRDDVRRGRIDIHQRQLLCRAAVRRRVRLRRGPPCRHRESAGRPGPVAMDGSDPVRDRGALPDAVVAQFAQDHRDDAHRDDPAGRSASGSSGWTSACHGSRPRCGEGCW